MSQFSLFFLYIFCIFLTFELLQTCYLLNKKKEKKFIWNNEFLKEYIYKIVKIYNEKYTCKSKFIKIFNLLTIILTTFIVVYINSLYLCKYNIKFKNV